MFSRFYAIYYEKSNIFQRITVASAEDIAAVKRSSQLLLYLLAIHPRFNRSDFLCKVYFIDFVSKRLDLNDASTVALKYR